MAFRHQGTSDRPMRPLRRRRQASALFWRCGHPLCPRAKVGLSSFKLSAVQTLIATPLPGCLSILIPDPRVHFSSCDYMQAAGAKKARRGNAKHPSLSGAG